nr:DNA helicase [Tanacetum cinerariifolium]
MDADGYRVISELMILGPCGLANTNVSCMKDGITYNHHFPKAYYDRT